MKNLEEHIVKIEKMSNLGTGITHINNEVVFVENCCTGDEVKIQIIKSNKNYSNAVPIEIIHPSAHRINPQCSLQKICGACQLQFIDYDYQLEIKRQSVEDSLSSIAGIKFEVPQTIPSPQNLQYRHKVQYPVSQTKVSKRLLAGYYKQKTHEIINIKHCPIHPEICDNIIDFIRDKAPSFKISGYDEKTHKGDLKHIVLRISADTNDVLVTLVVNSAKSNDKFEKFANHIFENFEKVAGVCLNLNPQKTNVILSDKTITITGNSHIQDKILDKTFNIGADTFFQVNPKSAENIFAYVKNEISRFNKPTILDAYAGIAAFGVVVSDISSKVTSVEYNKNSIQKAQKVLEINNINNVELYNSDTTKYLKNIKKQFDITILDPPRKGCSKDSLEEVLKHTKKEIIYVSCNPATLARDLKILCSGGCKLISVQPFDMFCHTYHVETVAVLEILNKD